MVAFALTAHTHPMTVKSKIMSTILHAAFIICSISTLIRNLLNWGQFCCELADLCSEFNELSVCDCATERHLKHLSFFKAELRHMYYQINQI